MANDGAQLFVTGQSSVVSVPKSGGAPTTLVPPGAKTSYEGIAVAGGTVYFADTLAVPPLLRSVPVTGGPVQTFATLTAGAAHVLLAAAGTMLYWTDYESTSATAHAGNVYQATLPNGAPSLVKSVPSYELEALAAYPSGYYVGINEALATAPSASPPYVYDVTTDGNGYVHRRNLADGTGWMQLAAGDVSKPNCGGSPCGDEYTAFMAAGATGAYWAGAFLDWSRPVAGGGPSSFATLYKLPAGQTANPTTLWRGTAAEETGPMTLDATTIYWLVYKRDATGTNVSCSVHATAL